MTTRKIALAISEAVSPAVTRLLAEQDIVLGPVVNRHERVVCYDACGDFKPCAPTELSTRERQMLRLFAEGMVMDAIARQIGMRSDAARTKACRLYRKLGARNKEHAVAIAYRMGVYDEQEAA